jgi:hypothetical protein
MANGSLLAKKLISTKDTIKNWQLNGCSSLGLEIKINSE